MEAEEVKRVIELIGDEIEDSIMRELLGIKLEEKQMTKAGVPGTEVPCDFIFDVANELYLVFGKDYIKKVRELEVAGKLDRPPVYFADGECPELRQKLGITEDGVYLLKKDKTVKKVKKF